MVKQKMILAIAWSESELKLLVRCSSNDTWYTYPYCMIVFPFIITDWFMLVLDQGNCISSFNPTFLQKCYIVIL